MAKGFAPFSPNTGAYCGARERLPEDLLKELLVQEARQMENCVPSKWTWNGRLVKLVDGTTLTLCDTDLIKKDFPLSKRQKAKNSLPMTRVVGLFSLSTGGLLDVAVGAYCGKNTGEHMLMRELIPTLNQGELVLGDGLYPSYFCIATLMSKGIDGVFASGKRTVDFRQGERIGRKDHIVEWPKSPRPEWMSQCEYDRIPETIKVREVEVIFERLGFKTEKKILFTTLTDRKLASAKTLSVLFSRRWEIEVHFRSIKSNLKMSFIPSKTPQMVRKTIYMTLIGYNLIRKIMSEAALISGSLPTQLSFQRTAQTLNAYKRLWELGQVDRPLIYYQILLTVAKSRVGNRPNRREPRRMRRAKHRYPLLKTKRTSIN
jgi:hypothetical protein